MESEKYNKEIYRKIDLLTQEEKSRLRKLVIEASYDRTFCSLNGIDYLNPDSVKINEIIYKELFDKNYK